jgi:hypothetical protein
VSKEAFEAEIRRQDEEMHAKFRELLRRDWAVRVLDAWRRENLACRWWSMEEAHDYDGPVSEHGCLLEWVGGSKDYAGSGEDAARLAAAQAVFHTLPAEKQAALGECP